MQSELMKQGIDCLIINTLLNVVIDWHVKGGQTTSKERNTGSIQLRCKLLPE